MKLTPTLEALQSFAAQGIYRTAPVSMEVQGDFITPIQALRVLQNVSRHCYLFESAEDQQKWGRYSFLGYDPKLELSCCRGALTLRGETTETMQVTHPGDTIRKILAAHKSPRIEGLPTFTGGLVGYFGYDYISYAEPSLKLHAQDEDSFKDVDLMLFDKVIAFDNARQKLILIVNIPLENLAQGYADAQNTLREMLHLLQNGAPAPHTPLKLKSAFAPHLAKPDYCAMVEKAKQYIYDGDIFQAVLSNRMEAQMEGSILDAYRVLRTTNPSPYMFYFSSNDIEIAGASPETLVKLENRVLHTFPLAGTRPRGKTEAEDLALEQELLADEKECSEHNMLVDLGRNDIGRISEIGSVEVEDYMSILRFSHVMHIGSTVRGILREDCDAIDAVDAILPAGTLSGAPKIRACEIIDELEGLKRGIYGGAIGYMDFTGNLDTCIAIRLAYAKNGKVFVRSGGGIVADSDPEAEYQERTNKAGAVMDALRIAAEGIDE